MESGKSLIFFIPHTDEHAYRTIPAPRPWTFELFFFLRLFPPLFLSPPVFASFSGALPSFQAEPLPFPRAEQSKGQFDVTVHHFGSESFKVGPLSSFADNSQASFVACTSVSSSLPTTTHTHHTLAMFATRRLFSAVTKKVRPLLPY